MKTFIRTMDIFDCKNEKKGMLDLRKCCKAALKAKLDFECVKDENGIPMLLLAGSKCDIIKYYILTLFVCENKFDGIKRLFYIIKP